MRKPPILLGGLPRSGSTLLATLLGQHPDIYITPTSPFPEILWRNYSLWNDPIYTGEFGSIDMQCRMVPFLQGMTNNYYSTVTDRPIVVDKSRSWVKTSNISMYLSVYGVLPKIIAPVRSVDEIMASWCRILKAEKLDLQVEEVLHSNENNFITPHQNLNKLLNFSPYSSCVHLVEYDDLVDNTAETLKGICEFIDAPYFKHSSDIDTESREGDYGFEGLHTLMPKVGRRRGHNTADYLTSTQIANYRKQNFWRKERDMHIKEQHDQEEIHTNNLNRIRLHHGDEPEVVFGKGD